MDEMRATDFIAAARALSLAAVGFGLRPPAFRSPPRRRDVPRTIRRDSTGTTVIAVRRIGRSTADVLADMVEGVLISAAVDPVSRRRLRGVLAETAFGAVGRPEPRASTDTGHAGVAA